MFKKLLFLVLLGLIFVDAKDCGDYTNTSDMKICHNKEYKEANKKINKVYIFRHRQY
jgi:uncharacterized protein YecT (DUF1311 family)